MTKAHILIVEDSRTQAESLQSLLSENGYEVAAAASGDEAIALLGLRSFDVVISDVMMPGMTGYELCSTLKSRPKWRDIPVMLLTTLSDPMDVIRGLECGADNFVTKPYQAEQLMERVAHVLDNRRLRHSKLQVGLNVNFLGQRFTITADKEQILDLLISTFEDAVLQNKQLLQREEELERARAELASYAGTLEERIGRVLDSISDIVYSISADRQEVFYISPACARILGFTPQQFAEDPWGLWERAIVADHRDRVRQVYERVARTGETETVEYPIIAPDGTTRYLEETIVPRREGGSLVRLDGIARDITERRRLEEQVRLAQKMEAVGTLAGGVAHDFNNLLTAIRGNAELALAEVPDGNPAKEDLAQIGEIVDRATAVTRQLLALGRQQVLEPRTVELNELIENSSIMLKRFIGADVQLQTVLTDEPTRILADPNQIDQILMNLTLNSRHAMPQGGELSIATSRVALDENFRKLHPWATPGDYVCLNVTDTGSGMSREVAARIFDPFFTTKQQGEGTGLGLAVVYGIVKQHGGLIHVYSEPGQGTTFKLYFPFRPDGDESASEVVADADVRVGGGETILYVEDDDAVRKVSVKQLRRLGYDVVEATNGAEALDLLSARSGKVDLVMLDVVMPVMGGSRAHEEIVRRFPGMRFLFMTGYSPTTSHLTPLSGIPGQILHKPFGLTQLAAAVDQALGKHVR